ncbi:acetate--CoA ligase family protein [Alloyangia pacifica]|uniref:Acetyl-CoA synthetase (ADP-forming) n=1 Tax=Alloyangia pacifica TaxID=311180 RepID=A0A1I6WE92_9RHOB|nr:acetate--CoA ligase [Alloyangia pacifica]SDI59558.1 acetyl-CoA synthetase (ADP-forming) [Alloyangia pacifica]SFT23874.1 acetyl-CoA synthetase (ADP-forming) [Alloyangia pacifica]
MTIRNEAISVGRIIAPRSIALVGATEDYGKFGGRILHHLIEHGYDGVIYPINPKRETVAGLRCYPSIADLPAAPDIAVVALPAGLLEATITACGEAGVGACIVITAQLGEFSEAGAALEARIVEIARRYKMRLVGPNCMGMIVPGANVALSSTPTLRYAQTMRRGNVAFVSQSGALMGALFVQAHDHGVGLSGTISIGNQADLDLCDFTEAFLERDDTRVVCLYIEGLKSPERFRRIALAARAAGKRLVAVKAGRTEAGSDMAKSHTSSLAGSYSAFEALCRDCGVLLVDDPDSMIICAGILAANPAMGTGGVATICASGGGGAIIADRFALADVPVARYSEATRQRLDTDYLRSHQNNPLDLGGHVGGLEFRVFENAIEAVHGDAGVAAFVYVMTPQPLMPQTLAKLVEIYRRAEKPMVFVLNTSRFAEEQRQALLDAGLPFVTRTDDMIRALRLLLDDRAATDLMRPDAPSRLAGPALPNALPEGFLTEPVAKALMEGYGVAVPRAQLTVSREEAAIAARALGYPVVLKGVVPDVVHKSDLGLVKPGIADEAALLAAWDEVAKAIAAAAPGAAPRIDVQQMIGSGVELIAGIANEGDFGPQVIIGAGGIHVELLRDVVQRAAPVSPETAREMLESLRIWPLLNGARGAAPLDVNAACDAISRLSWMAADLDCQLVDFEVNPLRVTGSGAIALDGRGTLLPAQA